MDESTYYQYNGQLQILEQIKNPSPWILEAIEKIKAEIKLFEKTNVSQQEVDKARADIEHLLKKYPTLEISYQIKRKQIIASNVVALHKIKRPELDFTVLTHISAQNRNYTFKNPRAVIFQNRQYSTVKFWKDVLEQVCNIMQEKHSNEISRILNLKGQRRIYFSRNLNQLSSEEAKTSPRKIKNTDIYMESNFSANTHVELCYKIIEFFDHKRDELNFITY